MMVRLGLMKTTLHCLFELWPKDFAFKNPDPALNASQLDQLREAFSLFDSDKNGAISKKELQVLLRSLGQSPDDADLRDMIDQVDATGDDSISFVEFVAFMKRISVSCRLARVGPADDASSLAAEINSLALDLFRRIRNDQTGRIDADKLESLLNESTLGPIGSDVASLLEEAAQTLGGAGEDGIDLKGFLNMMKSCAGYD